MSNPTEVVEALPLMERRRLLGILIPAINLPLFIFNVYQSYNYLNRGGQLRNFEFLNYILFVLITLGLAFLIPIWAPFYASKYRMEKDYFTISRFLRKKIRISYNDIDRADIHIKAEELVSKDALKCSKEEADKLRAVGFKFNDFSNAQSNIVMLMAKERIYVVSPANPRNFVKRINGRKKGKLTVKLVELQKNGARIRELRS